jgi:hypothetical protein
MVPEVRASWLGKVVSQVTGAVGLAKAPARRHGRAASPNICGRCREQGRHMIDDLDGNAAGVGVPSSGRSSS